jgi:WS/DGAT/MGAT family acyltransferase
VGPLRAAADAGRFLRRTPNALGEVATRVRALESMALWKLRPASETPMNGPVGPHRAFDWLCFSLDEIREMRRAAGCKLNDVVLAIVTGAVRSYMRRRGVRPEKLDFRASAPVNVREGAEREQISGNRVSSWVVRLPLAEADPLARLAALREQTQALKDTHQSLAVELVNALHAWLPFDIQAMSRGTMNTIVTNVRGPAHPLYLCGAELLAIYPQAPLIEDVGLVTGAISYAGRLCFGMNADADRIPDLDAYVAGVAKAVAELSEALGLRSVAPLPGLVNEAGAEPPAAEAAPAEAAARRARGARRESPASATH